MAVQEKISAARLKSKIGQTMTVLVDAHEGNTAIARGPCDAPDIDGVVYVLKGQRLKLGEFARVRITASEQHDLFAVPEANQSTA